MMPNDTIPMNGGMMGQPAMPTSTEMMPPQPNIEMPASATI